MYRSACLETRDWHQSWLSAIDIEAVHEADAAYLSGSCSANTFLLVWSRMTLILRKDPISIFFALNIDMVAELYLDLSARVVAVSSPSSSSSLRLEPRNFGVSFTIAFASRGRIYARSGTP
jgi:hypothetical protein